MTSLSSLERITSSNELASEHTHPHARVIAAGVAGAICVAIAGLGWVMAPEGWVVGVVGLPGTMFLAWRMGEHIATSTRSGAVGVALGLSVATILLADALVVGLIVIAASVGAVGSLTVDGGATFLATLFGGAAFGLFMFVIGAIVVGIPVAIVVVPAALIWAALVRFLVGRPA
jgi:hypothetical protein